MNTALLISAPLVPLLMLLLLPRSDRWWVPLSAVPALLTALIVPVGSALDIPWLLLGVHLEFDTTARLFLLFSALVWLIAGLHLASARDTAKARGGLVLFFLLAMAGNYLLILAADMLSFYAGFALMGLSAYGLVIQRRSQAARRAARVYLVFTLIGEVALFAAIALLFVSTGSLAFADLAARPLPVAAIVLLLLGFGIKVALPGMHVWLPPTYSAAPIVVAAVLSGPMMKAGLLGWLRFLPPGSPGLSDWGLVLIVLGTVGVAIGTVFGMLQREPRALLGYSSIAKMGLISALFGVALNNPASSALLLPALTLFALHHLLVKSALFLGVGEWQRHGATPWLLAGLGVLAATMAGLPLTGGSGAKLLLSEALADAYPFMHILLLASGLGTVLLMVRFFYLIFASAPVSDMPRRTTAWGWLVLLPVAFWGPFLPTDIAWDMKPLLTLIAGVAIYWVLWQLTRRLSGHVLHIRPGDLVQGYERGSVWLRQRELPAISVSNGVAARFISAWAGSTGERRSTEFGVAGLWWLALFLVMLVAFLR